MEKIHNHLGYDSIKGDIFSHICSLHITYFSNYIEHNAHNILLQYLVEGFAMIMIPNLGLGLNNEVYSLLNVKNYIAPLSLK